MKVIFSKGSAATGEARDAAGLVVISARRAELLRKAASNSSLPAMLDCIGAQCAVILWDEVDVGLDFIEAAT